MTLVEFLRARLAEEQEIAQAASATELEQWLTVFEATLAKTDEPEVVRRYIGRHIAHFSPVRVMADVAAKRRIMNAHARPHECIALTGSGEHSVVDGQPWELWEPAHTDDHGPCFVLRCLALPYAGHEDYREEWKP